MVKKSTNSLRNNIRLARHLWNGIDKVALRGLEELLQTYDLSVARSEIIFLADRWYVTNAGLLRVARQSRCFGIQVLPVISFCYPAASRWAFRATVFKTRNCKGFVGYGDADPSNVAPLVRGAEMRVAETRAVNRALRKAYGIGICSVEEIGSRAGTRELANNPKKLPPQTANGNGWQAQPKLRDRLCQLIRQHQLDPVLVKSYAVDFCGTKTLKGASREQVENFVNHLADWAANDKNALLCQLNSYIQPTEGAA